MEYKLWMVLLVFCSFALAAPVAAGDPRPVPAWNLTLGGSGNDYADAVQQTSDGGYVLAGYTTSPHDGDVGPTHGGHDYWVVKLDSAGRLAWNTSLGGDTTDVAFAVEQTTDGGYVVAGMTSSNQTGDVGLNHGGMDAWVVRLDAAGKKVWNRTIGGNGQETALSAQQTADGGYILAGESSSNQSGDVGSTHGSGDCWVVKLDGVGQIAWNATLGGSAYDSFSAVQQTSDGGYIVAGKTWSNDGDVGPNHGDCDAWVVKLDGTGRIAWNATLGGAGHDEAYDVQPAGDGGYIVAGSTDSDQSGDIGPTRGNADYWVVKLDGAGRVAWNTTLGGTGRDEAYAVQPAGDGGYVVAGETGSDQSGDVGFNHGLSDCWVVKLDGAGRQAWNLTLGGSEDDIAFAVQPTGDGGYVLAGSTDSSESGDVGLTRGGTDYWVVKLAGAPPIAALPGCADRPTATHADGLCDDINGNGRADFADVVLYFNQLTWIEENEPLGAFDYNGNSRIDFADVVWLFNHL